MPFDTLVPFFYAEGFSGLLNYFRTLSPAAEGCGDGVVGEEDVLIMGDDDPAGIVFGELEMISVGERDAVPETDAVVY